MSDPLTVACPYCKAEVGARCAQPAGSVKTVSHLERHLEVMRKHAPTVSK